VLILQRDVLFAVMRFVHHETKCRGFLLPRSVTKLLLAWRHSEWNSDYSHPARTIALYQHPMTKIFRARRIGLRRQTQHRDTTGHRLIGR